MIKYIFMAAMRDKLVLSLFLLMILGACLAVFLGSAAVIEKDMFVIVFAAGILRVASVFGIVLFVVFHVRRSFDTKDVDYLLSRPISRGTFVIAHIIAFTLMGIIAGALAGVALFALAPSSFGSGHVLWLFSIMAELVMMANVAFFFSMVLTSASSSALSCLGFYALARIIGQILGIVEAKIGLSDFIIVDYLMRFIGMVIPRLDLMGQTSWLVYGIADNTDALFIGLQTILFTALIASAAFFDLKRRQF